MTEIRTIVFDLGGVLIDYDLERCYRSFRALGFAHPEEFINPYRQSGMFLRLEEGTITDDELYAYLNEQVGVHHDPKTIDEAWCSFLIDIPDYKLDMLRELRAQGYRVFMLSNTNDIMFRWMERAVFTKQGLTVNDYFDCLFLSYKMHLAKPSEAIFREMIRQGGIAPEETLFLDDGSANIETAKRLGFHTYQPYPREDFRAVLADYRLKS